MLPCCSPSRRAPSSLGWSRQQCHAGFRCDTRNLPRMLRRSFAAGSLNSSFRLKGDTAPLGSGISCRFLCPSLRDAEGTVGNHRTNRRRLCRHCFQVLLFSLSSWLLLFLVLPFWRSMHCKACRDLAKALFGGGGGARGGAETPPPPHVRCICQLQIASQFHVKIKIRWFQSEGNAIVVYEVW